MTSRRFYVLCSIEGVIAMVALLLIPSEGGSLSPGRLALLTAIFSLVAISAWLAYRPLPMELLAKPLSILFFALLSLTFGLITFLLRYLNPEYLLPLYQRLSPLLWYLLVLSIQLAIYLLVLKNGFHPELLSRSEPIFKTSARIFAALIFFLLFIAFTKLGITKDEAYWGEPGVPILGWQFAAAILIGAIFLNYKFSNSRILGGLLPMSIWLTAVALWLSVPISTLKNSFYAPITPPYATPFPYSDAGFYDYLAQSLLIGTKYLGGIPPRPLYVTFLAALHFLFGQDYVKIIGAQTVVFAIMPVTLYWLGAKIHSRAAGVIIALFAIFRELTTLWISSNTRTASTKMFVTDFATAMGIIVVCLIVMRWLERRDTKSTLIAGGSFGLLLLLRTQSALILPFVFIVAWFVYEKQWKEWLIAGVLFALSMSLTVAPWLIHNYRAVGQFAFDDPAQMAVIYSQYSFNENLDISKFDLQSGSLGGRLLSFTLKNPGFVARFIANHFLNTEIGSVLALPLVKSFDGLLAPVNLYWIEWNGNLEWYNLALVFFYLAVIAVGLAAAWKRLKWIGLTPLAFNIGYALANGISRFSSWRYNLPADWIAYFYFGIGSVAILIWCAQLFSVNVSEASEEKSPQQNGESFKLQHLMIPALFVFVGALPWLAQGLASPRYIHTKDELIATAIQSGFTANELDSFLAQPSSQIFEGRLLYPRFFRRGDGIFSSHPWPTYEVRDYSRLGFIVLNENAVSAILESKRPLMLPHGADVIVVGCQHDGYTETRWVYFPDSDEIFQSGSLADSCVP